MIKGITYTLVVVLITLYLCGWIGWTGPKHTIQSPVPISNTNKITLEQFTQSKCDSMVEIGRMGEKCTCFQSSNKYECFHPLSNCSLLVIRCEAPDWNSCTVGDRL